jgi:hypothetical protein
MQRAKNTAWQASGRQAAAISSRYVTHASWQIAHRGLDRCSQTGQEARHTIAREWVIWALRRRLENRTSMDQLTGQAMSTFWP